MTTLYLTRHGKAEKQSASGRDEDRPLADRGRLQAAWLGEALSGRGIERVLSSPAERAWDTATIVGRALGIAVERTPWLMLGQSTSLAYEEASGLEGAVMLVGHEPVMGGLVDLLLHGPPIRGGIALKTGACAVVSSEDSSVWRLDGTLRSDD